MFSFFKRKPVVEETVKAAYTQAEQIPTAPPRREKSEYEKLQDLKLFRGCQGMSPGTVFGPIPVLKDVLFPNVLVADIWEKQAVNKGIRDLAKTLGGDWFNVCPINDLAEVFQLQIPHDAGNQHRRARENLSHIHCVRYDQMDRSVLADLINQINLVFSAISTHPGAGAVAEPDKTVEFYLATNP